ncbi:MAG: MerR family transcriptional regulator [Syntrophales bacterium]|nr:MerR family transcriptional regulator [Syntrophales bacterium]
MKVPIPDKAFFRIGEVSKILGVQPYVIRYWESEFDAIRPQRTSSSQRRYRRQDLETLIIIKELLYTEHFTIRGAKQELPRRVAMGSRGEKLERIKRELEEIRKILT